MTAPKMEEEFGWTVDIEGLDPSRLMGLYEQLKGGRNRKVILKIQCKIVDYARKAGNTANQDIVKILLTGVRRKQDRIDIAKEWCEALGIDQEEFIRLF